MNITLTQGQYSNGEATEIITKLIHVQIKFHEDKINNNHNEEDIKMREKKIIQLQRNLFELQEVFSKQKTIVLNTIVTIE